MPVSPSSDHVPLSPAISASRRPSRVASTRTSRANGSAYGYGGMRHRIPSAAVSLRRGSMAGTIRRRRGTFGEVGLADAPSTSRPESSNFAQRLLMANEMAVTNIADLWVAAAINADNEDVFISDEDERDFSDDDLDIGDTPRLSRALHRTVTASSAQSRDPLEMFRTSTMDSTASPNPLEVRPAITAADSVGPRNPLAINRTLTAESTGPRNPLEISRTLTAESTASRSALYPGMGLLPSATHSPSPIVRRNVSSHQMTPTRSRLAAMAPAVRESIEAGSSPSSPHLRYRGSRAFSSTSSQLPSIYANAGVRAPPGLFADPLTPVQAVGDGEGEDPFNDGLGTIPEGPQQSQAQGSEEEMPQSLFKQLPLMIILQYGLLALHSTTHDQIFLSYLVS